MKEIRRQKISLDFTRKSRKIIINFEATSCIHLDAEPDFRWVEMEIYQVKFDLEFHTTDFRKQRILKFRSNFNLYSRINVQNFSSADLIWLIRLDAAKIQIKTISHPWLGNTRIILVLSKEKVFAMTELKISRNWPKMILD